MVGIGRSIWKWKNPINGLVRKLSASNNSLYVDDVLESRKEFCVCDGTTEMNEAPFLLTRGFVSSNHRSARGYSCRTCIVAYRCALCRGGCTSMRTVLLLISRSLPVAPRHRGRCVLHCSLLSRYCSTSLRRRRHIKNSERASGYCDHATKTTDTNKAAVDNNEVE